MSSQNPRSLYPQVPQSDPYIQITKIPSSSSSSSSSLYPTVDVPTDMAKNLFPEDNSNSPPPKTIEETILTIPGSIVHLIDKNRSVELASGELIIHRLLQGGNVVAVFLRIGDDLQWPLAKDEASVKLDHSHYFFSLRVPTTTPDVEDVVNYGLTIASKGQDHLLDVFDGVLEEYSSFSVQKVTSKGGGAEVLDAAVADEMSPAEWNWEEKKKDLLRSSSAAYWTTLAPNVDDYSGCVARAIASGSGSLIKGILWCGEVTVDRLKWGNEFLRKRMAPCSVDSEVSPETLRKIERVKKISKMTQDVATGILSGVVKVSGFFTSTIVNSKVGQKFFSLLPGEIVLASLDGFSRVFDAVEVAGKNVMATTSTVTTGLVSHRYGDEAAGATNKGLGAAGHAIGTAWAVFKIRKALNPKSVIRPTRLVKEAAKVAAEAEAKAKAKSK